MRWSSTNANIAYCTTIQLRKTILEKQQPEGSAIYQTLEPSSAEFIAALAAGIDSRNIVQVGCGMSTIALAAAAKASNGFLVSVHGDGDKQKIVWHHVKYLGLLEFVEFITADPVEILLTKRNIDFAFFTGNPEDYIEFFDLLDLAEGAIVAVDNALTEDCNKYIQHVRRQPGIDSSTLPIARGIEVSKLVSWKNFQSGRVRHSFKYEEGFRNMDGIVFQPNPSWVSSSRPEKSEENALVNLNPVSFRTSNAKHGIANELLHSNTVGPSGSTLEQLEAAPSNRYAITALHLDCEASTSPQFKSYSYEGSAADGEYESAGLSGRSLNPVFQVQFQNHKSETQISITGVNQEMLLFDIATVFSEMGISVKTANISTHENTIEDVFFVVSSKTGEPLHPSQYSAVKEGILQKISNARSKN